MFTYPVGFLGGGNETVSEVYFKSLQSTPSNLVTYSWGNINIGEPFADGSKRYVLVIAYGCLNASVNVRAASCSIGGTNGTKIAESSSGLVRGLAAFIREIPTGNTVSVTTTHPQIMNSAGAAVYVLKVKETTPLHIGHTSSDGSSSRTSVTQDVVVGSVSILALVSGSGESSSYTVDNGFTVDDNKPMESSNFVCASRAEDINSIGRVTTLSGNYTHSYRRMMALNFK